MNTKNPIQSFLSLTTAALLLAGCGGPPNTATVATDPGGSSDSGTIAITGNDQMQFDRTEFTVAAGSEVTLTFQNVGKMPKDSMGHNLVILAKDVDPMAFANASVRHAQNEYVAPDFQEKVIASTRVLGPGEKQTVTFTAPSEPGDYPFVCSFPGHTPAGMRGIMKVK